MKPSILITIFSLFWSISHAGVALSTLNSIFKTPEPMQEKCLNHKGKVVNVWKCVSLCQHYLPMPNTMCAGFCRDDLCQCSWAKLKGSDQRPATMKLQRVVELRKEMDEARDNNKSMKKFKNLGWLTTVDNLPDSYAKPGSSQAL